MSNENYINRKDFKTYKSYLSEAEYTILKKVIINMLKKYPISGLRLLDFGCWDGVVTKFYGNKLGITDLFGIEYFDDQIVTAKKNGIKVTKCDVEKDSIPFEDNFFDIVIANQIFEHLKNIYKPLGEIHRVLKPNGIFLFGVPNLASLHCRLQLLFGTQPSQIQLFESHVRAFTPNALKDILTFNNLFILKEFTGSGYYPFPPSISEPLSKLLKKSSVFQLYLLQKNDIQVPKWEDEIKRRGTQSVF